MKIDLSSVPNKPGCYLWKDKDNNIIYVGKAKKLRNRMSQYFRDDVNPKTKLLVKNIDSFDYVLTENDSSSLITELNLINKYSPKYNIKLKQTKSYPYIKLSNNPLKIEIKRKYKKDVNSKYFGPFPEGFGPGKILKLLESIYPIGKCLGKNNNLPCINYQLGLCLGYCFKNKEELLKEEKLIFQNVSKFLKGNVSEVQDFIIKRIETYSEKQMFEQAMKINSMIPIIERYKENQKIIFEDEKDRDIIGFYYDDGVLSVAISYIRYGKLLTTHKELISIYVSPFEDSLIQFLQNYYLQNYIPHEIITNLPIENFDLEEIRRKIINPQKGIKLKLLNLAFEQSKLKYESEKEIFELKIKKKQNAITNLKEILKLSSLNNVEMVDISNLNGKHQVGAVVSFKDFSPNKDLYRKYSLEDGNDDYKNIYEVTYRHFRRKMLEKIEFPDLYIVDGKNQIKSAKKALDDLKITKTNIIGLVKNKKHDTHAIITHDNEVIVLPERSELYLLLGEIQDEVHRFAIEYHRNKKTKELIKING